MFSAHSDLILLVHTMYRTQLGCVSQLSKSQLSKPAIAALIAAIMTTIAIYRQLPAQGAWLRRAIGLALAAMRKRAATPE